MFRVVLMCTALLASCTTETVDSSVMNDDLSALSARPVEYCGGFLGLQCSDPTDVCVDDPSDNCDPNNGGADCIGICKNGGGNGGGGNGGGNAGNGGNGGNGGGKKCKDTATQTYVGHSLDECASIRFVCDEGTQYFADDCGCGCEVISS